MTTCMAGIVSKRIANCIHRHDFHQQIFKQKTEVIGKVAWKTGKVSDVVLVLNMLDASCTTQYAPNSLTVHEAMYKKYSFTYMYDAGSIDLVACMVSVYTSSVCWVTNCMMYELEIIYYA